MAIQKNYKDKLCRIIFREKENLMSLYNALNHSKYTNLDDLTITTLEDVIYMSYKNDISFLIYDDLFLVEHQSTINPNMALRSFMYYGRLYQGIVDKMNESLYGSTIVKIPTPHSYVLYNGDRKTDERNELRLSDSFIKEDETKGHEWTTTVLNINRGYNQKLLDECKPLNEYMYFVNQVKDNKKNGMSTEEAIDQAINDCIKNKILDEILRKNKAEVKNVCLTEFDQEKYEETIRREEREKGREEGIDIGERKGEKNKEKEIIQTLYKKGYSPKEISNMIDVDIKKVEKYLVE